ncbi:hypothetical protein JW905_12905 [bacterium]|nr:hypothetical protein [candidate division CSSED10-310 bacterium]
MKKTLHYLVLIAALTSMAAFLGACSSEEEEVTGDASVTFTSDEPVPQANSVYLELSDSSSRDFEIKVMVDGINNAYGIGFNLDFDPAMFAFESGTEGDFLNTGAGTNFFASSRNPGSVVVSVSRVGTTGGVTGNGLICTLTFRVLGEGTCNLRFTKTTAQTPDGDAIGIRWISGTVTIVN